MEDNEIKNNEEMENNLRNEELEKDIEKEWADALHFDKWPPDPNEPQTPPRIPEEAMVKQPVAPEPQHAPEPYQPQTPNLQFANDYTAQTEQPAMPSTYLVWSVLATILCCFIPGIVAIVYSTKVSSRYFARDYEGAEKASEMAQYWIIGSIVLGLVWNTIYLPLMLCTGI